MTIVTAAADTIGSIFFILSITAYNNLAKEATSRLDVALESVKQARGAPLPTISGAIADVVDDFIFGREEQFQTE